MEVIINADDFGYSIETNEVIYSLIKAGRVTSATIMANGPAFQDALDRIRNLPGAVKNTACSFGVHLNVTEFHSLTSSLALYDTGVVSRDGLFTKKIRRSFPNLALMKAIENEWGKQIEKVLDQGITISHLDSHHHIHTVPWLFPVLKRIQMRYRIKKIRICTNWYYRDEYSPSKLTMLGKKVWIWSLRNFYKTITTDGLTSFEWFIANLKDGEKPDYKVIELMCHPGRSWASNETELLWSDWITRVPHKIELVSFNHL